MNDGWVAPGGAELPGGWAAQGAANTANMPAAVASGKEQFVMVQPSDSSAPAPPSGVATEPNRDRSPSEPAAAAAAAIADRLSEQIDAHDALDRGQDHRQVIVERQR